LNLGAVDRNQLSIQRCYSMEKVMFNRINLPTILMGFTALAVVGASALSTPAFAAAKQSDVVAACKRTKGCVMYPGTNGGVGGCSPHACFSCTKGKCVQTAARPSGGGKSKPSAGSISLTNRRTANGAQIHRGNTAPVNVAAPINNHARMGGRH
jgi:hypothetical protein